MLSHKHLFRNIFLLAGALLYQISCYSQSLFQKTYGSPLDEVGFCARQTSDGGYILSGAKTIDSLNTDIYLVKTNALGDTTWIRYYGGPLNEYESIVQQTSDGGYVIAGSTYSYGAGGGDIFVVRTNPAGDTLWTKTYGGPGDEIGQYIQQTNDGGFIIGGHTDSFGPRGDFYMIKTNAQGDTLWTRSYGGTRHDHGFCVQQTSDSGYIICGHSLSFLPSGGFYAVKTNSKGDTLWTKGYGLPANSYCTFGIQTSDGGYIFTGSTDSSGAGGSDGWVVKTNAGGDTLWTRLYGGAGSDNFNNLQQTADGGYILAGSSSSFGFGGSDVYLVKINAGGAVLWSKVYGGEKDDEGSFVSLAADSGFVIGGSTRSYGAGGFDAYLIKTDKNGNTSCHQSNVSTQVVIPPAFIAAFPCHTGPTPTQVGSAPFKTGQSRNLCFDDCGLSGIALLSEPIKAIRVYPSPSNGTLNIQSETILGLVTLYNGQGKQVYARRTENSSAVLDISSLAPGLYMVEALGQHIRILKD